MSKSVEIATERTLIVITEKNMRILVSNDDGICIIHPTADNICGVYRLRVNKLNGGVNNA